MTSTPRRNRRAGVEDRWFKTARLEGGESAKVESANHGKGKRWRARYVDDEGREHVKGFERKIEAQKWLDEITAAQVTGSYVDPVRGQVTFGSFYREWSQRQVWETNTRRNMDLTERSVPFSNIAIGELRASHFEAWVKAMRDQPLAAQTIKARMMNVRSVLKAAIRDQVLAKDPSAGVSLPRLRRAEAAMVIPTSEQVGALVRSAPEGFEAFIALCAFAGTRAGETAAFRVSDFDFLRREIAVSRQVQRVSSGVVELRPPKYGSERVVAAPAALLDLVAEHIRVHRPSGAPDRWLFPGLGENPLESNMVGTRWRKTKKAASVELKLHSLRHYFASGLIAAGCDVVTVQRALGHSSASVTLDTYSHLWPKAQDRTRKAAEGLFGEALGPTADGLRTEQGS
ncbi:tyrosine-type recombinase/integrase [Rhodococcus sp. SGAir0479]|uniref:tyrosine-type recombinase/integrase n=1 Tax=Rhodococcus sp. SGAir0479 TaxID=2567884 RepID=UPI0010CCC213|nr:site-specific integrase [Rhodococcus sp. SGAir0479]QCQ93030.1 site-specific integrase [Rhodococcus sp. SGAir0479]